MMNDKTKLVKYAQNDKANRCCRSAYQKKRLGEMRLGEMLVSARYRQGTLSPKGNNKSRS